MIARIGLRLFLAGMLLGGLLGCKWAPAALPAVLEPGSNAPSISFETELEESSTEVVSLPATPVPALDAALPDVAAAPSADPLRFTFPTFEPPPVSAWRPPLYPTPWAISPYDHFYFARPIAADEVNWPLEDYRYGGIFFENVVHTGIDITAPRLTPVIAAGPGKVVWAGYGLYGGTLDDYGDPYGLAVAIHHDFGYEGEELYTVYGHLNRVDVARGQWVDVGQMLGLSGETGKVTGPHLHFEVRIGNNSFYSTRNPELWLSPPQGWGLVAGRVTNSGGLWVEAQEVIIHSIANGQEWYAKTYGGGAATSDPYYKENVVIGDLPAGKYEIRIPYGGRDFKIEVEVLPGVVTFFTFTGLNGFSTATPAPPGVDFTPQPYDPNTTPTPEE